MIKTLTELKTDADTNIRAKTTAGSISKEEVADQFDNTIDFINKVAGKVMLTFGDSITDNYTSTAVAANGGVTWVNHACAILGITNVNYAVWGTSLSKTGGIWTKVNEAITANVAADIIVIAGGTNDYSYQSDLGTYSTAMAASTQGALDKDKIFEAVRYILWRITEHWPDARIFFSMPPQNINSGLDIYDLAWLYDAIEKMCGIYGVRVVNTHKESGIIKQFEVISSNGRYLADGLHPNANGKIVYGKYIANEIRKNFF
jgi:lysophospholipase L1-like esterase